MRLKLKHIYFCSETEEVKYLFSELRKGGYKWETKDGYEADEFEILNYLIFDRDFLTYHTDKAFKFYVYENKTMKFEMCGKNSVIFFRPTRNKVDNFVYPERVEMDTIYGRMPVIDYLEIVAKQKGFYSLKSMKSKFITIDILKECFDVAQ